MIEKVKSGSGRRPGRRWARRVVALAAVVAPVTAVLAAPGTALAGPEEALARCEQRLAADHSEQLHMDGGRGKNYPESGWNDDHVWTGDVIRVVADAEDTVDVDAWWAADGSDLFTPAGNLFSGALGRLVNGEIVPLAPEDAAPDDWPAPGRAKYSLFGVLPGWNDVFFDFNGHQDVCLVVPGGVDGAKLTLAINDPGTWDNSGAWDVRVDHYWG